MKELDFIYKRHSVRSFTEDTVPEEHIREMVKAATYAPSGKNLQNWHFVIIQDRSKIAAIAKIAERKNGKLAEYLRDETKIKAFKASIPYITFFKGAPLLVLVYAGHYESVADLLLEAGVMPREEALQYAKVNPGIQNIAAALENFQLAAANLGYGTCWMTGPTYAGEEISAYIGFHKDGYSLAAMTPLGVPASKDWSYPVRKSLDEVLTIIK